MAMATALQKQTKPYCHPAFYGLTDEDLISVYNTTTVRKLNAGDILVKEGDTDQSVYFILEGSAQILKSVNGASRQISVLRQGDSIPGASAFKNGTRTTSAVALEPLSAFELDETSLNAFSHNIQSAVYRNLHNRSVRRINDLMTRQANLSARNEYLTSHVARFLKTRTDQYASSEIIQGFLKGIPRLPMYANRLAVVLVDENVSTRDVAELAKLDPSLVSVVLKVVNSAYYGFQRKISDFERAVLLLGFSQVYQLVMDIGIRTTMPKTPPFQELLFHSMMISFLGFEISQFSDARKAVTVSTLGLLHDIGYSVILLLKERHPKMELLIDTLDHSKIGSLLLKQWNIPDIVCQSLEYQCYPEWLPPGKIPEEHRHYVTVLHIAHLCCQYMEGKSESELPTAFLGEYMKTINCSEKSIAELVEKKIFPSMHKKLKTLPDTVRQFLIKAGHNVGQV
jgi:HD-like signal output (HDOD) protein